MTEKELLEECEKLRKEVLNLKNNECYFKNELKKYKKGIHKYKELTRNQIHHNFSVLKEKNEEFMFNLQMNITRLITACDTFREYNLNYNDDQLIRLQQQYEAVVKQNQELQKQLRAKR